MWLAWMLPACDTDSSAGVRAAAGGSDVMAQLVRVQLRGNGPLVGPTGHQDVSRAPAPAITEAGGGSSTVQPLACGSNAAGDAASGSSPSRAVWLALVTTLGAVVLAALLVLLRQHRRLSAAHAALRDSNGRKHHGAAGSGCMGRGSSSSELDRPAGRLSPPSVGESTGMLVLPAPGSSYGAANSTAQPTSSFTAGQANPFAAGASQAGRGDDEILVIGDSDSPLARLGQGQAPLHGLWAAQQYCSPQPAAAGSQAAAPSGPWGTAAAVVPAISGWNAIGNAVPVPASNQSLMRLGNSRDSSSSSSPDASTGRNVAPAGAQAGQTGDVNGATALYQQLPMQQKVGGGQLAGQHAQRLRRHASFSAPLGPHEMGSEERQAEGGNSAGQARRARHFSAGHVPDVFAHFEVSRHPAVQRLWLVLLRVHHHATCRSVCTVCFLLQRI